ncbi:MAG: uroporphyrinogen-III synthase, partial [Pseudomonadota bacterium]|nr:uroporphyrinogen-III synthase [Pseudomonadota bacterium]
MAAKATIALFRAREDAAGSAAALAQRGLAAALAPVIEIGATGAPAPEGPFDFAIASSAKAFAFADAAALAALIGLPLHVVGEQ